MQRACRATCLRCGSDTPFLIWTPAARVALRARFSNRELFWTRLPSRVPGGVDPLKLQPLFWRETT